MSRIFSGPHGLTEIELFLGSRVWQGKLHTATYQAISLTNTRILEVVDEDRHRVLDAFQETNQPLLPALQYLADLAGAATGLEVEVRDA